MYNLKELITSINSIKSTNGFLKYIESIQFPYYRNLAINSKISFEFPLTVFIGQNGCGKSSALHALYGAPFGKTPFEFWFDTKVDPVEYYDDEHRRHSFWYSYNDEQGKYKEVIKARIKRDDNPNYWETSRPLNWAGMKISVDGKRDSPIKKDVLYLDFRSELSAFDKFFYFGDSKNLKEKNKQEFIRVKSEPLKELLDNKIESIYIKGKIRNSPLYNLNKSELNCISYILGREYVSAKLIKHNLFITEGFSVLFNAKHATYSEAFAGSGEMAVVRLVTEILKVPKYSLILLDEPEVSLHPGAQNRLKLFLLNEIKRKKLQIVISTHSPILIGDLPKSAIKVFHQNPNDGRFLIKEGLNSNEAFFHIEYSDNNVKRVHVEDKLSQEILIGTIKKHRPEAIDLISFLFNPGGESVIKKEFIKVFCREFESKDYIVFDGDQKKVEKHIDYNEFPISKITIEFLKRKIKDQTGVDIKFSVDGGDHGSRLDQQLELLKKYSNYYLNNVFYLPKDIPEDIIWDNEIAANLLSNSNSLEIISEIERKSNNSKDKFKFLTEIVFDNIKDINACYRIFINKWLEKKDSCYSEIISLIDKVIDN